MLAGPVRTNRPGTRLPFPTGVCNELAQLT